MSPDLPPMSPAHERPTRPIIQPTSTTSSDNIALPPSNNPVIPPRVPSAPSSRPTSTNSEALPPVSKRSMLPLPETTIVPNNLDQVPASAPASSTAASKRKPHSNTAPPSTPEDPADAKIRQLIKQETEKIRKEFESRLEEERIERLKLQVELDELKATLNL